MNVDPCLFVIFGGTGDLARRKLLPALTRLVHASRCHVETRIVGVGLEDFDTESYRRSIHASLIEHRVDELAANDLCRRLHYRRSAGGESIVLAALATQAAGARRVYGRTWDDRAPRSMTFQGGSSR